MTNGADPDIANNKGSVPLHVSNVESDNVEMAKLLIKHGCKNADRANHDGHVTKIHCCQPNLLPFIHINKTPIFAASVHGNSKIIEFLLSQGARVNKEEGEKGLPPIIIAANLGREAIMPLIVEKGKSKINVCNPMGDTPLHLASKNGFHGIVSYLLQHGADPSLKSKSGQVSINSYCYSSKSPYL